MSIIIHFNPAPFISSAGTIQTSACLKAATAKLEMAPGIKHDTDGPVMTDDSSIGDLATSNTLYEHMKDVKASTHHVTQSLNCYFGLPYQDHNYGAPPPPTPPSYSPYASPVHTNGAPDEDIKLSVVSTSTLHEETHEGSITRCVCGFAHDDEYMICCDRCLVWQHVDCMGLDRNNMPETYMCEKCQPRKVDKHKAKVLQARKKVAMTDSSDSDNDNKNSERRPKTRSKSSRRKKEKEEEKIDEKSENHPVKRSRNVKNAKERMEIKRKKLRRTKNKESTSTADEEAQDAWEYSIELCDKNFEPAINNQYTPEVQLIARTLQSQGKDVKTLEQLQAQLCQVEEIESNKKRLYSACDIPRGQPVIEYKGKFLLTSQFYEINPLFNKRLYPYVLFHSLLRDEICVDASFYGNDARFIRRSCKPNSEIRHLAINGNLHLYVSSTKAIFKDEEITIPFDFCQNDSVAKDVECACERDFCVLRHNKKNGDEVSERKKRLRQFTSSADDDSSHSLAGLNSPVKSKQSPVKSSLNQISPVSTSLIEHMDTKGTSDQEPEEQAMERRKKMTREERKIDAIMRAFDQMEKAAKRRQQALDRLAQQKGHQPKSEEPVEKPEVVVTTPIKEEEKPVICNKPTICNKSTVCNKSSICNKPAIVSGSETSCIEDEKEKPIVSTPTPKPKKGKRRRGSGTQIRRRTRTNSGGSDILSADDTVPQVPNNVPMPIPIPIIEEKPEISPVASNLSTPPAQIQAPLESCPETPTTVVLKTKRLLLQEWMHEKSESTTSTTSPCSIKTEVSWNASADAPTCYVRCTKDGPNVVGISAAHLRRSSSSGQLRPLTGQGSAKKRWLRQAMYDCNTLEELSIVDPSSMETIPSPLHNGCLSPSSHGDANSPSTSTEDIVTPLKKRRLMRESVESMPSPKSPSSALTSMDWTATSSSAASYQSSSDFPIETTDSEDCVGESKVLSMQVEKEEIPVKINGVRDDFIKALTEKCTIEDLKVELSSDVVREISVPDNTPKTEQSQTPEEDKIISPKDVKLKFEKDDFRELKSEKADFCELKSEKASFCELKSEKTDFCELKSEKADLCDLKFDKADFCELKSEKADFCELKSKQGEFDKLKSEKEDFDNLKSEKNDFDGLKMEEDVNQLKFFKDLDSLESNKAVDQQISDKLESKKAVDQLKFDKIESDKAIDQLKFSKDVDELKVEKDNELKVEKDNELKVEKDNELKVEKSNDIKVEKDSELKVEKGFELEYDKDNNLSIPDIKAPKEVKIEGGLVTNCMSNDVLVKKENLQTLDNNFCDESANSKVSIVQSDCTMPDLCNLPSNENSHKDLIQNVSQTKTEDELVNSEIDLVQCTSESNNESSKCLTSHETIKVDVICTETSKNSDTGLSEVFKSSTSIDNIPSEVEIKDVQEVQLSDSAGLSSSATRECEVVVGIDSCSFSSVSSTSEKHDDVASISTSEVQSFDSSVVTSVMSELPTCSSTSSSAVVNSISITCSRTKDSSPVLSTVGDVKLKGSKSSAISTSRSIIATNTSTACASATQKRKVSLSEYRLRMKDAPTKIRAASESPKKNISSVTSTITLDTSFEQLSFSPLTLKEMKGLCPAIPVQPSKKTSKPKEIVKPVDDDAESDTTEHHRENLTERLRREFGLDDSPEEGSAIPVVVSQPKSKTSGMSSNMKISPILTLCGQPLPPPPPPPPRLPRTPQVMGAAPMSTQFNYPISSQFPRPPYVVPQVPSSPYIGTPTPMPSPVLPAHHHQLPPTPPHPMLSMVPYGPSLPPVSLRPPSRSDYASVNAQNFASLVQQPPPPPNQSYHMYQAGYFK